MVCRGVLFLLVYVFFVSAVTAHALPFNDDMVHDQLKTGEVMRAAPEHSIPIGASERYVKDRDAALKLTNPIAGDELSTRNGQRLWEIHCSMCHGVYTDQGYKIGVVNQWMPGPNLADDTIKGKSDGHFFGYVYFGGLALMPRYGWKLSITEHWDLVNYIREVQGN